MTFGQTLRQAREAAGLTQQQLAARLHIAPCYICQMESGKREPGKRLKQDIAALLAGGPDALCLDFGVLAPDLEAWLVQRPKLVAQIRERMERGKERKVA